MPDLLFSSGQLNWREATLTEKNMKGGSDLQPLTSCQEPEPVLRCLPKAVWDPQNVNSTFRPTIY